MVWKIRASSEVLGPEGNGVRTRSVRVGGTRRSLQFGKEPVFLNTTVLPPEIEQDRHLVKTLVRDGEAPPAQMVELDITEPSAEEKRGDIAGERKDDIGLDVALPLSPPLKHEGRKQPEDDLLRPEALQQVVDKGQLEDAQSHSEQQDASTAAAVADVPRGRKGSGPSPKSGTRGKPPGRKA